MSYHPSRKWFSQNFVLLSVNQLRPQKTFLKQRKRNKSLHQNFFCWKLTIWFFSSTRLPTRCCLSVTDNEAVEPKLLHFYCHWTHPVHEGHFFLYIYRFERRAACATLPSSCRWWQVVKKAVTTLTTKPQRITAVKTHHLTLQLNLVTNSSLQLIQMVLALQWPM